MIQTNFPQSWTDHECEVYLAWTGGADLTDDEIVTLSGCFERIRKGDKPWASLADDFWVPDEQLSKDGYGPLDLHKL